MALYWKAAAGVLLAVILGIVLGKKEKDLSVMLSMAVCAMGAMIALSFLEPVIEFLDQLAQLGDLQGNMLGILLKAMGIGLVTEITGLICSDAGNASLGKTIQMLGSAVILWLSLPVFNALLDIIQQILGDI